MPEVVSEGDGLGEIFVEAEGAGDGAANGGDFDGVGEPGAKMIPCAVEEDLGFIFETAKGAGMDDAGAVALEFGAVGVGRFLVFASGGKAGFLGVGSEGGDFHAFEILSGAEHKMLVLLVLGEDFLAETFFLGARGFAHDQHVVGGEEKAGGGEPDAGKPKEDEKKRAGA